MGKITFENHILLCGWVARARDILRQLFAPDLKEHRPVVIIDPDIEESPMDHPLLKVIRGDPVETEVLEQANAKEAHAAIVLADQNGLRQSCHGGMSPVSESSKSRGSRPRLQANNWRCAFELHEPPPFPARSI